MQGCYIYCGNSDADEFSLLTCRRKIGGDIELYKTGKSPSMIYEGVKMYQSNSLKIFRLMHLMCGCANTSWWVIFALLLNKSKKKVFPFLCGRVFVKKKFSQMAEHKEK